MPSSLEEMQYVSNVKHIVPVETESFAQGVSSIVPTTNRP